MNAIKSLSLVLAIGLLTACSDYSTPFDKNKAAATPGDEPIAIISPDQLPAHYTVVGTIRGYTTEMLQKKARALGADAIINPTDVDPVSGWATTEAIKYGK